MIRIPRSDHSISRKAIHPNALKVLYRLHQAGYIACLVGGCVRDLLLNRHPKDFDIATDAHPDEVRKLFKNCRLIGRRFRLAHIIFGQEIIEVATFRTHHENAKNEYAQLREDGMILRDNVYGTMEDDVWRRDFTVNALYYNIADFSIIDYMHGMQDIELKQLRIIGEAQKRFIEDPVRLLRTIRFAGKLNFVIHADTEKQLSALSYLLEGVSSARLFQEVVKLFHEGATYTCFQLLEKYHLLKFLFGQTATYLNEENTRQLIELALKGTDQRIKENKKISPTFLFATLLWRPFLFHAKQAMAEGLSSYLAAEKALKIIFSYQLKQLAIPRHMTLAIRDIIMLQHSLTRRYGRRPWRMIEHPRFRAAYDLLLLRAETGEDVIDLARWWIQFTAADTSKREKLLREINHNKRPSKKKRKFKGLLKEQKK